MLEYQKETTATETAIVEDNLNWFVESMEEIILHLVWLNATESPSPTITDVLLELIK